jgi:hypothetical protein
MDRQMALGTPNQMWKVKYKDFHFKCPFTHMKIKVVFFRYLESSILKLKSFYYKSRSGQMSNLLGPWKFVFCVY